MRKRLMWMLGVAALLMASVCVAVTGANPVPPEMTVVVNNVNGSGDYLELGLRTDTKSQTFQSAGVVLKYNATALKPCGWLDEITDALLEAATVTDADLDGGKNIWDYAIPIPTKGMDALSGKTAFTVIYKKADGSKDGYLYLNVEAPTPREGIAQTSNALGAMEGTPETDSLFTSVYSLDEAKDVVEQLMTVRFAFLPKADNAETAVATTATADDTAGTGVGDDVGAAEPEPPMNHKYGMEDIQIIVVSEDLTYGQAGTAKVAEDSPVGGNGKFFMDTESKPLAMEWSVLTIAKGISVGTGSGGAADPSSFASIVFYDWDDTLLGSIIVPKGDATKYVQEYENSLKATDDEKTSLPDDEKSDYWANIPEKPLTYKKGYIFEGVWLDYSSNTFTCYKDASPDFYLYGEPANHDIKPTAEQGCIDFTNVNSNLTVKAAYKAAADINRGGDKNYIITNVRYSRYGNALANSGTYSIRFTVKRENQQKNGVARLQKPAVKVNLVPEAASTVTTYILLEMDNQDSVEVEIAAHKLVMTVRALVIDREFSPNWASQAIENSLPFTVSNRVSGTRGTEGFIRSGTIGFINENGILENNKQTSLWNYVNINAMKDAGFTVGGNPIESGDVTAAKQRILNALLENGNNPLSKDKMIEVVNNVSK